MGSETMMEREQPQTKPARGPSLLCESHVRDYIRETAKRLRPGSPFERVSDEALAMLEYRVKKIIDANVRAHRMSKTFKDVI